ncbi:MAG: SRPBCC domain-containing protein [bacterium]
MNYTVEKSIIIRATPAEVWDAIINPEKVKQYLFGTDMSADWRVGGKITYKGSWDGKEYEDGGTILELDPEKLLKSTYWSSMSGTENIPENQMIVTYRVDETTTGTSLTIMQENSKTQEASEHSGENWNMVLSAMKKLIERK